MSYDMLSNHSGRQAAICLSVVMLRDRHFEPNSADVCVAPEDDISKSGLKSSCSQGSF